MRDIFEILFPYATKEHFSLIGNRWDSKGENEIDIVALNRIDRQVWGYSLEDM